MPADPRTLSSPCRAKIAFNELADGTLTQETYGYSDNGTFSYTSALPDPAFPQQPPQSLFVSADSTSHSYMPMPSNFDSPPYTAQMEASVCAGVQVPSTAGSSPLGGNTLFGDFEPIYNDYFYTDENDKLASVDQWKDYLHSEDAAFADVPTTAADALAEDLSWLEEEIDQNLINEFMADPYFCEESQPLQSTFQPEQPQPQQHIEYIYYEQPSSLSSASASPPSNYVPIAPRPASQSQSPQPASNTVSPAPSNVSTTTFNIPPVPTDRKRRKPMTFTSAEEEYAVKRQLNNIASARSRQKKKEEVERRKTELVQLESRNRDLKCQFEEYERQIETLKTILYSKIQK